MLPHVTILMATYNGADFILDQLRSIRDQTHKKFLLLISDDGSTDGTLEIAKDFAVRTPEMHIQFLTGPCKGSCQNFWNLVDHISHSTDYVAFSDQDDVWMPDKLSCAIKKLEPVIGSGLYGARFIETDANLLPTGVSMRLRTDPSFKNALVQNVFSGNSCVLNRKGVEVLRQIKGRGHIFDWYLYQVFSGAGAKLIYDTEPKYFYRQHKHNQIGSNLGLYSRLMRMFYVLCGRYRLWNEVNLSALTKDRRLLTKSNRRTLAQFRRLRNQSGLQAILSLKKIGLKRQGELGQVGLILSAVLGKL